MFKVNPESVAIFPFKGYAPGAIDVNRVTLRLALQTMKIITRHIQVLGALGGMERSKSCMTTLNQIRPNPAWVIVQKKAGKALVPKAADHGPL
ncbi:MAG: hypothetical protein OEL53_00180 [Rhodospirillales bacterium]|nr:hypothetical protein [Rhodospirillales bacterium]